MHGEALLPCALPVGRTLHHAHTLRPLRVQPPLVPLRRARLAHHLYSQHATRARLCGAGTRPTTPNRLLATAGFGVAPTGSPTHWCHPRLRCLGETMSPNGFKTVIEIDVMGTYNMSYAALPGMR